MKIELLYILDCPWCVRAKELIRRSLKGLKVKADIEEILIDSDEKAGKYNFVGSPTIKINGKDIQEEVSKGRCLPCEEFAKCRIYFYKGKQYPYPPKEMIEEAIKKFV